MPTRELWVDEPMAVDVLRQWLEQRGFGPMQPLEPKDKPWPYGEPRPQGYFTKSYWSDKWGKAAILYRGGSIAKSREKLTAVAELLDVLGVYYEAQTNEYRYPMLVVELSDALWRDLPDDSAGPAAAASASQPPPVRAQS